MAYVPSLDLVPGVLAGEVRAIARLLTPKDYGVAALAASSTVATLLPGVE